MPLPINEAVELQIPVNGWIISAQLMLKLGFLDSAQAICDGGLCICSVQLRVSLLLKIYPLIKKYINTFTISNLKTSEAFLASVYQRWFDVSILPDSRSYNAETLRVKTKNE